MAPAKIHDHTALGTLADLLGLVAGLVLAFAGYRLLRSLAALAGLLTGFAVGLALGTLFGGPLVGLVVAVGLAVVLALVFVFAFRVAGAVVGGLAGAALAGVLGWTGGPFVVLVVIGVVVGLVANRIVLVLATALEGGLLFAQSAVSLADLVGARVDRPELVALVVGLVVAALGAASQWRELRERGY
jgi:hypothetical protein